MNKLRSGSAHMLTCNTHTAARHHQLTPAARRPDRGAACQKINWHGFKPKGRFVGGGCLAQGTPGCRRVGVRFEEEWGITWVFVGSISGKGYRIWLSGHTPGCRRKTRHKVRALTQQHQQQLGHMENEKKLCRVSNMSTLCRGHPIVSNSVNSTL